MKCMFVCLSLLCTLTLTVFARETVGAENSNAENGPAEGNLDSETSANDNAPQAAAIEGGDAEGVADPDLSATETPAVYRFEPTVHWTGLAAII